MAAIIRITQVGLGAGTSDKTRTDGLLTGGKVTVDSVGAGAVHTLSLLWIPDGDAGFAASFAQPLSTQWTWDPTPGSPGTYIILLDVDGDTSVRLLRMRTANLGLIVPGLNEAADPAASLINNGAALISASQDNEDELALLAALASLTPTAIPKPFLTGNYGGWYRLLRDFAVELDDRAAGRMPQGFQAIDSLSEAAVDTGLTFLPGSDEVELSATGTFWDVFFGGKRKRFETTLTIAVPFARAENWVTYDLAGAALVVVADPDAVTKASLVSQNVLVAVIVTDTGDELLNVLMTDMRHGLSMSPADKMLGQLGIGSLWADGLLPGSFTLGDGSLDTHAQFDLTDGLCVNQDQSFAVTSGAPAADPQALSPVLDVARWLYRTAPGEWSRDAGSPSFPTNALGVTPGHNANGTSLVAPADGEYVLATYFAVKSITAAAASRDGDRLIAVAGQAVFTELFDAQAAAGRVLLDIDLAGLPNELVPVCTVIIQADSGFANAADARIVATASGAGFVDHRRIAHNGGVEAPAQVVFDPDTIVTAAGAVVVSGGNVVVAS